MSRIVTERPGAVVLLSGGMDSATLLAHVVAELRATPVFALSFHYGQRHARELEMARWQARAQGVTEHVEIDISFLGGITGAVSSLTGESVPVPDLADLTEEQATQPSTYVPNRNMVLLAIAASFAESRGVCDVYYGAQAQDYYGYWDCTPAFVERLNSVLALNRRHAAVIHAPFVGRSKTDVLRLGLGLGVDYGHTWSCYRGGVMPCGRCPSCVERARAFAACGISDQTAMG